MLLVLLLYVPEVLANMATLNVSGNFSSNSNNLSKLLSKADKLPEIALDIGLDVKKAGINTIETTHLGRKITIQEIQRYSDVPSSTFIAQGGFYKATIQLSANLCSDPCSWFADVVIESKSKMDTRLFRSLAKKFIENRINEAMRLVDIEAENVDMDID